MPALARPRFRLPFESLGRDPGTIWAPRLAAALVLAQLLALGANGPLLAIGAATLDIAVAIAILAILPPRESFWRQALPLMLLALLLCAWVAAPPLILPSMLATRPAPDLALSGAVRIFGGCATLLGAAAIGNRRGGLRATIDWLIVAGVVDSVVGLALRQYDPGSVWGWSKTIHASRFTGTMLNANTEACIAGVTAILAFGRAQALRGATPFPTTAQSLAMLACVIAVILEVGTCAITGSRTVLALTLVALVGMLLTDRPTRRLLLTRETLLAVAGIAAVLAVLIWLVGDVTLDRFSQLGNDAVDRAVIWRHYADLAAASPLLGYGIGAFTETNALTLAGPADAMSFWYVNSAHDEPIELLIEGGPVFCLLLAAMAAMLVAGVARRSAWEGADALLRAVPLAIALLLLESLVDIVLDVPAAVTLLLLLTGLLWGRAARATGMRRRGEAPTG